MTGATGTTRSASSFFHSVLQMGHFTTVPTSASFTFETTLNKQHRGMDIMLMLNLL